MSGGERSEPDERGIRTVMCTVDSQLRPINVRDRSVSSDVPGQVAALFDGVVERIATGPTQQVEGGDLVLVIDGS